MYSLSFPNSAGGRSTGADMVFICRVDMLLCSWFPLYSNLTVQPVDLTGRNVIVTGGMRHSLASLVFGWRQVEVTRPFSANAGIGLESARQLAAFNANVTLACRDAAKGERARLDIVASTGNQNVTVHVVDVSSFASVRSFVSEWGDKPVDILIK